MCSSGKEVITLQFGTIPNFIGAHFFNIQNAGFSFNPNFPSDFNADILFREGVTDSGSFAFTPRLVVVDLEQSLSTLSETGRHHAEPPTLDEVRNVTEADNVEIYRVDDRPIRNEYMDDLAKQASSLENGESADVVLRTTYDLTQTISSWSEILTNPIHPRSITKIPKPLTSTLISTDSTFKFGHEIWNNPRFFDIFDDNLRFQLEASDCLQGFHLLTESDNLFAGLSDKCHEHLRDECGKKTILTIPTFGRIDVDEDQADRKKRFCSNLMSCALSLTKCQELSDLVAPMSTSTSLWEDSVEFRSLENLHYVGSSTYQSSSVLAMALELMSSPYRSKKLQNVRMCDIEAAVTLPGRKFVGTGVVLPFPDPLVESNILEILRRHKLASLCPFVPLETSLDVQNISLRGFLPSSFPQTSPALFVSPLNLRLPRTFPDVLPSEFDLGNSAQFYGKLREMGGISSLCNSREMRWLLEVLIGKVQSFHIRKIPSFVAIDLENLEIQEAIETLFNMSSSYDVGGFL